MMAEIVSKSGAEGFEHLFPELNFEEEINGEYPAHIEASLQIEEAIEAARMLVKTR